MRGTLRIIALFGALFGASHTLAQEVNEDVRAIETEELENPLPEAEPPAGIAGYFPSEGFAIKSTDGNFKLRVGLQGAYRLQPYWNEGQAQDRKSFFVLRPFLEGYVFKPWIRFWTSFEFASNPPFLLDSYVEIQPVKPFGLRIGQQYTPYSRHEYAGPHQILFPEWSIVADYFWSGRDKGITAMGDVGKDGILNYWAGVYAGSPLRQFTNIHGNYVVIGRVTLNPMGAAAANEALYITSPTPVPFRVSFTLQGYHGKIQSARENFNPSSFSFVVEPTGEVRRQSTVGGDIWLQGRRFTALAEGNVRRVTPLGAESTLREATQVGVWGQVGVMIVPRMVDLGVRANFLDPSLDVASDRFFSVEGQVGIYPVKTQNLVVKLRYGYGFQQTPAAGDESALTFPAPFGTNHMLTLQLGIAI